MNVKRRARELTAEDRIRFEVPLMGADDDEIESLLAEARQSAPRHAAEFQNVRQYCMFIGYPRSGHSIVGSMLDAHPDIIIAHELNALKFIQAGCSAVELNYLLLRNSREFTQLGRRWGDYEYKVEGQWQGRYRSLEVIGDKKGGTSSHLIGGSPDLLGRFLRVVTVPVQFIHVVRNPFDNIATMTRKDTHDLKQAIRHYFNLCAVNTRIIEHLGSRGVLTIKHEELVASPAEHLRQMAGTLGVTAEDDWVKSCSAIVMGKPHRSREGMSWPAAARQAVENKMAKFGFLRGYRFEV